MPLAFKQEDCLVLGSFMNFAVMLLHNLTILQWFLVLGFH